MSAIISGECQFGVFLPCHEVLCNTTLNLYLYVLLKGDNYSESRDVCALNYAMGVEGGTVFIIDIHSSPTERLLFFSLKDR